MKRTIHNKWNAVTALLLSVVLTACATGPSAFESKDRLAKAQAMFAKRCQTAGEKIYRTVDKVEGIFLLKLRPQGINYGDQFALTDPYGDDLGGDGYIESFVRGSYEANHSGTPMEGASLPPKGYFYVEAVDPKNGQRYRYTGEVREHEVTSSILVGSTGKKFKTTGFVVDKALASGAAPRYGVTYDDISTHEEREYWIAGSSLKVIDLQTNEVLGERVGYMMDVHQGSQAGGRSPWLFAADHACPDFTSTGRHGTSHQPRQADRFVEKILNPKQ